MLRTALLRASIVVLAAWGGPALASCVAPGGAGGCFATIQAAITAAAQGETIDVAAGTFTDAFTVDGSARLTIRGAGVGATVLDGSTLGTYPIAGITNNARVALEDMTLQNGTGYIGGARSAAAASRSPAVASQETMQRAARAVRSTSTGVH